MSIQENTRVLGRRGARELKEEEAKKIYGGIGTTTLCTIKPKHDGDPGEC